MKPASHYESERNQLTRFQILMQRRHHIEKIFWSRIQTLHLIQAGVLGGSFFLWHKEPLVFAPILLSLGILLTIILYILCRNDWEDAKINDDELNWLYGKFNWRRIGIRPTFLSKKILSNHLLFIAIGLFIFTDIVVLFYVNRGWAIIVFVLILVAWVYSGFSEKEKLTTPPET